MDFTRTEAQRDLAALVRSIVTDRVTQASLRAVEANGDRFDPLLWAELGSAGVLGAGLPSECGGGGFGLLEQCAVLIELGRVVAPVPYLASITMASAALAQFGDGPQRERWLAPALAGELVLTAALTEEQSDLPEQPLTTARRGSVGWLLTGTKTAVPAGTIADLILIPASTPDGAAIFLVRRDDPGVTVRAQRATDGDSEALIELSEASIPADRRLGGPDALAWLIAHGTAGLCALQLGILERALELTAEYAKTREQFGRPIGSFQAVGQRLADAYIDVEAVRLTLWQAAWRLAEGLPAATELATAKFWAADAGHRVAHTAVHVHGGAGIDMEHELHRYFVAAKRNEFSLGAATVHLRRLGTELASVPA